MTLGRKKTRAADIRRSLSDNDPELSPFASIKLVEKKESEKKKPLVRPVPKKPSEIVQGYNPSSSFADILYSYEHTGNPYSMPSKGRKAEIASSKTDFGAILDKWEGRTTSAKKAPVKKTEVKKSTYTPTKSFGEILSSFEGKPVSNPSHKDIKKEELPPEKPLFRKESEDEKRSPEAVWSIFGSNELFVRKEEAEKKEEKESREEVKEIRRVSKPYKPVKSFADILSDYDKGKRQSTRTEEKAQPDIKHKDEEDSGNILSSDFFRKESEDEKRSPEAVWSVFGNNRIPERKKEEAVSEEKAEDDDKRVRQASSYENNGSFPALLSRYEKKAEKTFDEILKEKGDGKENKPVLTISKLRTMLPQATLDLHGETVSEAEKSIRSFLSECVDNGLRKISIITGKGLHSSDGVGVLRDTAIRVLDESGIVSEKCSAPQSAGGAGALWIILKA